MSGKIKEKSGKFEVDDKWQPCTHSEEATLPVLFLPPISVG